MTKTKNSDENLSEFVDDFNEEKTPETVHGTYEKSFTNKVDETCFLNITGIETVPQDSYSNLARMSEAIINRSLSNRKMTGKPNTYYF